MSRLKLSRRGEAGPGQARLGAARRGTGFTLKAQMALIEDMAWPGKAWQGTAGLGMARLGKARVLP